MKRIIAALLTTAITVSITACGSQSAAGNTASSDAGTSDTASVSAGTSASETAAAGASDKVYTIATDTTFAPFEFEDDNGNMVGIDLELLDAIAKDQGFKYELEYVGFSAAVTALEAGEIDGVIAGMSITDERKQKYDFSDPYFDSGVAMAVLSDSDINSYDALKGKTVAVKIGTESETFANSIKDKYGFEIKEFEDSATMYQDVLAGTSAAVFDDYPVLGYQISKGIGFKMPLSMEQGSSYGFATLKGANPELVEMFDKGLADMKANGTYDKIINKYISK